MPHPNIRGRRGPAAAALLILLLACIGLAACGGSSSTTSSSANAAATATTSGSSSTATSSGTSSTPTTSGSSSAGSGHGTARFAAMRECLQKNGITLPKRTPGSRPGGGFLGANGGPQLPHGVTRTQYEVALKKCGGHFFASGAARRLNNPVFKAALAKYAVCLRQNGINVPAPNTSGNGPIFDTKGIDTTSAQFRSASTKCRSALVGAFRYPAGARGASGTPSPGEAPAGEASG